MGNNTAVVRGVIVGVVVGIVVVSGVVVVGVVSVVGVVGVVGVVALLTEIFLTEIFLTEIKVVIGAVPVVTRKLVNFRCQDVLIEYAEGIMDREEDM